MTFFDVEPNEPLERVGAAMRRDLGDDFAKTRDVAMHAAADEDEVLRRGPLGDFPQAPLKSDARDVMLTASIRAAADLHVEIRCAGDEVGACAQMIAECAAETA